MKFSNDLPPLDWQSEFLDSEAVWQNTPQTNGAGCLIWKPELANDAFVVTAKENDGTVLQHYVIGLGGLSDTEQEFKDKRLTEALAEYCSNQTGACEESIDITDERNHSLLQETNTYARLNKHKDNHITESRLTLKGSEDVFLLHTKENDWCSINHHQGRISYPVTYLYKFLSRDQGTAIFILIKDTVQTQQLLDGQIVSEKVNTSFAIGIYTSSGLDIYKMERNGNVRSQQKNGNLRAHHSFTKPPISLPLHQSNPTSPLAKFRHEGLHPRSESSSGISMLSAKSSGSLSSISDEDSSSSIVYPASCKHSARPRAGGFYEKSGGTSTLPRNGTVSKSFSVQDLPRAYDSGKWKKSKQKEFPKRTASQSFFGTLKRGSTSKQGRSSPESSDFASFDSESISGSNADLSETFYKSFEDLVFEEPTLKPVKATAPRSRDKCHRLTTFYKGDVWTEFGSGGGVVKASGAYVSISLHVFGSPETPPEVCECCSNARKPETMRERKASIVSQSRERKFSIGQRFSKRRTHTTSGTLRSVSPKLKDYDCPVVAGSAIDGHLVFGLDDPPDSMMLSNHLESPNDEKFSPGHTIAQSFIIAGPAVRIDMMDKRLIEAGAVIHMHTNTVLRTDQSHQVSDGQMYEGDKLCTVTCLQSFSYYGPYKELQNCYQSGNSLQATLDTSSIPSQPGSRGCQVYVVPVVKQAKDYFSLASLWEGVFRKSFHVGIYGPSHTYGKSTCCVSISSSGFCPPNLKIRDKLIPLTLRLLGSYVLVLHKIQGFRIVVRTSKYSSLLLGSDLSECVFTEEELRTEARINRVFLLRHASPPTLNVRSPDHSANRRFNVELIGLKDKQVFKMACKAAKLKTFSYPRSLSPTVAQRLANDAESSVAAMLESKLNDVSYQWLLAQQDARLRFHIEANVPGQERQLFGVNLGFAVKANNAKKRNTDLLPYLTDYQQGDYIPLLSQHTLRSQSFKSKNDWLIGYYKHRVGLIKTSHVKVFKFDEFSSWNKVRINIVKLVEALISPIEHLLFDQAQLKGKLISKVTNWSDLAIALRYGVPFAYNYVDKESDPKIRKEKATFFVGKYLDHLSNNSKKRAFQREAVRALLYSEHYQLAAELVTDFCIITLSVEIASRWKELANILIGKLDSGVEKCYKDSTPQPYPDINTEANWKPAYNFLCYWRKRFDDNHKGALLGLHHAVDGLLDFTNSTRCYLIECIVLMHAFDTLRQYDTKL